MVSQDWNEHCANTNYGNADGGGGGSAGVGSNGILNVSFSQSLSMAHSCCAKGSQSLSMAHSCCAKGCCGIETGTRERCGTGKEGGIQWKIAVARWRWRCRRRRRRTGSQ